MKTPRVSVLIPNYNYARFLPEALDSVLQQDCPEMEIILADDASTDHSDDVCRAYARRDRRIRYHRHATNQGMVENWNWCLQQARGTYIRLLMADDILRTPTALSRMVAILDQAPHIALITSERLLVDANTKTIGRQAPLAQNSMPIPAATWMRQHLMQHVPQNLNSIGEPSAVLFRKAQATRGFDPAMRQFVDLEMWLHLLQQGDLYYLAEPLCAFRKHPQQQTEHNRSLALHRLEELEIYTRYSPPPFRNRHRYRIMRRMCKEKHPHAGHIHQALKQEFGTGGLAWHAMRYRYDRMHANWETFQNHHTR